MSTKRLSLCMIVRDERETLPDLLASVAGLVDELCVVDTGSIDGTPELCARAGARLRHLPWQGDFSAARNRSLRMATGEWILVLDADERVSPELAAEVRALVVEPGETGAATVVVRNELPHGERRETTPLRLFRNHPGLRFRQAVREDLCWAVGPYLEREGLRLARLRGRVDHLGYVRDRHAGRRKKARDVDQLRRQLAEDPANLHAWHALLDVARFWRDASLWREAALHVRRQLDEQPTLDLRGWPHGGDLLALVARGLHMGDARAALGLLDGWQGRVDPSAAYLLHRGEVLERLGLWTHAREAFLACLASDGEPRFDVVTLQPLLGLCRLATADGRFEEAARLAERALSYDPRYPQALQARVALARATGGPAGVRSFAAAYRGEDGETVELLGALGEDALSSGELLRAVPLLRQAAGVPPRGPSAQSLAQALLACGKLGAARTICQGIMDDVPQAGLGVLVCDLVEGRSSDLQFKLDLASAGRALRLWVRHLWAGRRPEHFVAFARSVPAIAGYFPWLPGFVAGLARRSGAAQAAQTVGAAPDRRAWARA